MSAFPQPILPSTSSGIDSAPWLGNPRIPNPAGGLVASLSGVADATGALGSSIERANRIAAVEAEQAAAKQARLEEQSRAAANQRYLTSLETQLLTTRQQATEAAVQADPVESGKAYDAVMSPILSSIDELEDEDLRDRARLQYQRTYTPGRERVGEMSARRLAESGRQSIADLERQLVQGVVLGDQEPEAAVARHAQFVSGFVGTTLTGEQAIEAQQRFTTDVVARYADRLIDASAEDPAMATPLRDFLGSDLARLSLTASSRRRISGALDDAERTGHVRQYQQSMQQSREGLSAMLLADDTPDFVAPTADPEGTIEAIDGLVSNLLDMPGRALDTTADRPAMSEQQIRKALLSGTMEAAAESGNADLFNLVVEAAKVPSEGGRVFRDGDLAAKADKLRETLAVAEDKRSTMKVATDALGSAFATGQPVPPDMRGSEALGSWAKEQLVTTPAKKVADWLARSGATLPDPITDRIAAGFSEGAQDGQIAEAIEILRTVQASNPEEARRLASATPSADAAGVVLELGGDANMARMLLSPEGRQGLSAASLALGRGIDTGDETLFVDPATIFQNAGLPSSDLPLPPSALRRWEAAFRRNMVAAGLAGADMRNPTNEVMNAAATQAIADVKATHAVVEIGPVSESFPWLAPIGNFNNDVSARTLVPAAMFGLPSEKRGRDDATARFEATLREAQERTNAVFFSPTGLARPDLAMSRSRMGNVSVDPEILIPVIETASSSPIEFVGWNPLTRQRTRIVDRSAPDFAATVRWFEERTPIDAIDHDRRFRRPPSATGFMEATASPALADLFQRTMTLRYQNEAVGDIDLETYMDLQAKSMGWEGWKAPPEEKP